MIGLHCAQLHPVSKGAGAYWLVEVYTVRNPISADLPIMRILVVIDLGGINRTHSTQVLAIKK